MDVEAFLWLAKRHADLGWAIQGQLHDVVVEGEDLEEQNPNALREAAKFLRLLARDGVEGAADEAERIERYLREGDEALRAGEDA